jgi:choline dehydrogenase-like flavoprotein
MHNFHIAGASVFPTAGANFPTFTLTALSLRLADHLAAQCRPGTVRPMHDASGGGTYPPEAAVLHTGR